MKHNSLHSGIVLLTVVFTAICLFTFAGIVLASAKQTEKQANNIIERQQDYYLACNHAEQAIADSLSLNGIYDKSFVMNEDENLQIVYKVTDGRYTILSWKIVNLSEWAPEQTVHLFK
jgi:hypothetical protein